MATNRPRCPHHGATIKTTEGYECHACKELFPFPKKGDKKNTYI